MNIFIDKIFLGILLFNESLRDGGTYARERQVRHHRHWLHHGDNDLDIHTFDGSDGPKNVTPLWIRRNVYFLHIHNHLVLDKGLLVYLDGKNVIYNKMRGKIIE